MALMKLGRWTLRSSGKSPSSDGSELEEAIVEEIRHMNGHGTHELPAAENE